MTETETTQIKIENGKEVLEVTKEVVTKTTLTKERLLRNKESLEEEIRNTEASSNGKILELENHLKKVDDQIKLFTK